MIEAAALLPTVKFIHLGFFEKGGSAEELAYRDQCVVLTRKRGANITPAFGAAYKVPLELSSSSDRRKEFMELLRRMAHGIPP